MGDDEFGGFLDREQLLGGSPGKRATTLLFLIETRTMRLADQSRRRLVPALTEASAEERALEFVEAFALAREEVVRPSVYELERQASKWASLVPDIARLRAALARTLGGRYRLTPRVAPAVCGALGVDRPDVQAAFQDLYGEPLGTIFAARLSIAERARWAWTALARRLEGLPGFWIAYLLTVSEMVGTTVLAMPIAFATLGPLPAIAVLVAIGLVNVLTVALMAEAVVRTGPLRYANSYLGRLYESNLGRLGAAPASAMLALVSFLWISICYLAIGTTLGSATPVPAAIWIALLFAIMLVYLRRGSLGATIATAIAVGVVSVALILAITLIGLAHVQGTNLLDEEVPYVNGQFDASVVALVFGVALMGYFGHVSTVTCASMVLERDPDGRSLIRGCVAAQLTAIVVYSLFVVAVVGAVGASELTGASDTPIPALAAVAGPAVTVFGSVLVIISGGMGSVMEGLVLSWLVRERLPAGRPRIVVLPKRRARLVFRARRDHLGVGVVYAGRGPGGARFSVEVEQAGALEHRDLTVAKRAELVTAGRHRLAVEVLAADDRRARVAVTSTLRMSYEGELDSPGLDLGELLESSDAEAALTAWLVRSGESTPAEIAAGTGASEGETAELLAGLTSRGLVSERQTPVGPRFSVLMASRRGRSSDVWAALTDGAGDGGADRSPPETRRSFEMLLGSKSARLVLSALPATAAFVIAEWLVIAEVGSFAGLVGFLGVITASLVCGLYPVLLVVASRRTGEYRPDRVRAFAAHPVVLVLVYVFFLGVLAVHGTAIWTDPVQRTSALAALALMVALPAVLWYRGVFAHRVTVELRDDQRSGSASFAFLSGERPVRGTVRLEYGAREQRPEGPDGEIGEFSSLRRVVFALPRDQEPPPDAVKVWAHQVTPEGESESLSATAIARGGGSTETADLAVSRGEAVFPLTGDAIEVEIALRSLG